MLQTTGNMDFPGPPALLKVTFLLSLLKTARGKKDTIKAAGYILERAHEFHNQSKNVSPKKPAISRKTERAVSKLNKYIIRTDYG